MKTKDIEEVYNDILAAFGAEPIDKEAVIETLSTLTQHHQAEVVEIIKEELRNAPLEVQMSKGVIFANVIKRVSPTTTDKQLDITSNK